MRMKAFDYGRHRESPISTASRTRSLLFPFPFPIPEPIPSLISFYKLQQCHLLHTATTATTTAFNLFAVQQNTGTSTNTGIKTTRTRMAIAFATPRQQQ